MIQVGEKVAGELEQSSRVSVLFLQYAMFLCDGGEQHFSLNPLCTLLYALQNKNKKTHKRQSFVSALAIYSELPHMKIRVRMLIIHYYHWFQKQTKNL